MSNKAIIITIGDELLIGQTVDTNAAWMGQQLNAIGIDILKKITIADNKQAIRQALDEAIAKADIILITGGLGPTADDITKPILCDYFGSRITTDSKTLKNIQSIFKKRHIPILERNLKQAEVPDNCEVVLNKVGTAPGMWFHKGKKHIISMPGVPQEMMMMMTKSILPGLKKEHTHTCILHRHILLAGIGESMIAEQLTAIETSLPATIKLAYLPTNWMVKLRLTAKGKDKKLLQKELNTYHTAIIKLLAPYIINTDNQPLEQSILESCVTTKTTLSLAESCTGGYIGHSLTQVEGSSQYFYGGIVCYDNSIKQNLLNIPEKGLQEHGAISEYTVRKMAEAVRKKLKTTYGFGITGWLSEAPDSQPELIGTVWMAVCDDKKTIAEKFVFPYDRIRNKDVALQMALWMIWKFINHRYG